MCRCLRSSLVAGLCLLIAPAVGGAAPLVPVGPAGFSTDSFRMPSGGGGLFDVRGGAVADGLSVSAGLWTGGTGAALDGVAARPLTGLTASVDVLGVAGLDVEAPVALDGSGAGDTRVAPRFPLLRQDERGIDLAVVPAFSLPTGSHGSFLGDGLLAWAPELALSRGIGAFRLAANVGYRARPEQQVAGVRVGRELTTRAGLGWRPSVAGLETGVTLSGAKALQEGAASGAEAFVGASYAISEALSAFAGGGAALAGGGAGTPVWRGLAGVRFTGDLYPAAQVRLPPDRDGDGFADADDKCPDDPEDPDGRFDDGCPDFDDDNDGVPDLADACPETAGDADHSGCPPGDTDGDGLADQQDNCPAEKGSFDGCPTPQLVRLRRGVIDLSRPITFEAGSAELAQESAPLLEAVAKVIAAHPEILRVRVEGHTDNRGRRSKNVALSQDRAKAVANGLADRGVSPRRLSAVGFGPAKPIDSNDTEVGRAINRRVELVIAVAKPVLPKGVKPIEQDDVGPVADSDSIF